IHIRKESQQESNAEHLARKRETSYSRTTTGYAVFVIPPLPRFTMSCQKEAERAGEFIQMGCLSVTDVMMKYIEVAVNLNIGNDSLKLCMDQIITEMNKIGRAHV